MKTKHSNKQLQKIIKSIRDKTFDYEARDPVETNWTKYDQAQVYELTNYLDNLRDLVDEANRRIRMRTPPKKRGPGRPPNNPADIAKVLLLQTYTNSPNRVAQGFLLLFQEKLGISKDFSYKTIERGYDRDSVNLILDEVVKIVNECVEGEETTFSFDGTGFSASNKENYAAKRQKQNSNKNVKKSKKSTDEPLNDAFPKSEMKQKMGFSYCVMGIGVEHKLISGMAISPDHSIGETTMFPEAFGQTLCCHPNLEKILGDGIYASRWIVDLVSKNDATAYFLPRSNVTFKSKGFLGWKDMLGAIQEEPQKWLEEYHMRSISETVNSMVKCRFGAPLRKRLKDRRRTETRLKLIAHNVRRVAYLEIVEGIGVCWGRKGVG